VVGGALYASRWHRDARRFATAHKPQLRHAHVWSHDIGPTKQVNALMALANARGHATLGGRLAPDAQIREWARDVALELLSLPRCAPLPIGVPAQPFRELLATLCFVVGFTAIAGGADLLWTPQGVLVRE
jgi:hypothetical protein